MNKVKHLTSICVLLVLNTLLLNSAWATNNYGGATNQADQYNQYQHPKFSDAELAQILAPIALYPDSLLTHIIIASTYPLELVQAQRWREQNQHLDPASAVELAEKKGWDPSVTALIAFDSVLARLNDDLQWTQDLGDAFLEDEARVLDTIQDLRLQAERANSLNNLENMRVTKVNRQIVIEPIRQEIVYVPYYDTRVVYGNWHWRNYPPVYWDLRPHISLHFPGRIRGHFAWHAGININFNYFFSAFNWRHRHVVVSRHHKTRHYRPHHRIALSHGATRWQHKPIHRRGVAYRSDKVSARFYTSRHNSYKVKQTRQQKREHYVSKRQDVKRNLRDRKGAHKKVKGQDYHRRNSQDVSRFKTQKNTVRHYPHHHKTDVQGQRKTHIKQARATYRKKVKQVHDTDDRLSKRVGSRDVKKRAQNLKTNSRAPKNRAKNNARKRVK